MAVQHGFSTPDCLPLAPKYVQLAKRLGAPGGKTRSIYRDYIGIIQGLYKDFIIIKKGFVGKTSQKESRVYEKKHTPRGFQQKLDCLKKFYRFWGECYRDQQEKEIPWDSNGQFFNGFYRNSYCLTKGFKPPERIKHRFNGVEYQGLHNIAAYTRMYSF